MKKDGNMFASLREHLGIIRSCALMMAHAQSAHARAGYLKTLTEKIVKMDALLTEMESPKAAQAAAAGAGQ